MFSAESRFIVADDFATMRKIIKKTLLQLGYKYIEEAEDGIKALEKIKVAHESGQSFDCILADWEMPHLTGIELKEICSEDPKLNKTPFLLITTHSEKKQRQGSHPYPHTIIKPFSSKDLSKCLKALYDHHFTEKAA